LQQAKDSYYHSTQFHASADWCMHFTNGYGLALQQHRGIAQKLQQQLESKVDSFLQYIIKLCRDNGYELSQTGNLDETQVTFDTPENHTAASVGDKIK